MLVGVGCGFAGGMRYALSRLRNAQTVPAEALSKEEHDEQAELDEARDTEILE